jgi:hypothetical protein
MEEMLLILERVSKAKDMGEILPFLIFPLSNIPLVLPNG